MKPLEQHENMKTLKEILTEYENADTYERTLLFLAHRDLRDVFMEIELRGYQLFLIQNSAF
jgi:hypothetical protein